MNKKDLLNGLIISIITLVVGYGAIAIPFNLLGTLNKDGERLFFIIELAIYITIGSAYLLIKDKQEKQAKKEQERHIKRREKIEDVKANWYDLAA